MKKFVIIGFVLVVCCVGYAKVDTTQTSLADVNKKVETLRRVYTPVAAPKITTVDSMIDVVWAHTLEISDANGKTPQELGDSFTSVTTNYFAGGWGYLEESACVLRQLDGGFDKLKSIGVSLEYKFVKRRIHEEMMFGDRANWPGLHCLRWKMLQQSLVSGEGGRCFDHLVFEVTGYGTKDLELLKSDMVAHNGYEGDPEGLLKHEERAAKMRKGYVTHYWFDITSFFGKRDGSISPRSDLDNRSLGSTNKTGTVQNERR